MNWENLLKRNIAVTTGKTKTVDIPLEEDDEDCFERYRAFIYKLKDFFGDLNDSPYGNSNFVGTYTSLKGLDDDELYCLLLEWFEFIRDKHPIMTLPFYRKYLGIGAKRSEKYSNIRFEIQVLWPESEALDYNNPRIKNVVVLSVLLGNDRRVNRVVVDLDLWDKFIEFLRGAL